MRAFLPLLFSGLLLSSLAEVTARAQDKPQPAAPDFQKDVLPVFEEKCISCHGAKRRGGKLDMRTPEALLEGGDTGPALKPGNAQKSLLIELIHYKEMPPKKKGPFITSQELEMLRRWINSMPPTALRTSTSAAH
jgi:mono/diheme cytochrome c family protein